MCSTPLNIHLKITEWMIEEAHKKWFGSYFVNLECWMHFNEGLWSESLQSSAWFDWLNPTNRLNWSHSKPKCWYHQFSMIDIE